MAGPYNITNPYRTGTEPHLDPVSFNQLIATHGIRVSIEKTTACPNYIGDVGDLHHDVNCTFCENGYVHFDPIECWVVFQQNQLVKSFLREGLFDPGQALLSIPSKTDAGQEIIVSYFDRVTLLDQKERFYQRMNKSQGDLDVLRYQALEILHLIDATGHVYQVNNEFELDEYGNIHWLPGKQRPQWYSDKGVGEIFTVSYLFRPVYRILDLLHEGRYSQIRVPEGRQPVSFPQLVLIKKDYYITKTDVDGTAFKEPVQSQKFTYDTVEPTVDY